MVKRSKSRSKMGRGRSKSGAKKSTPSSSTSAPPPPDEEEETVPLVLNSKTRVLTLLEQTMIGAITRGVKVTRVCDNDDDDDDDVMENNVRATVADGTNGGVRQVSVPPPSVDLGTTKSGTDVKASSPILPNSNISVIEISGESTSILVEALGNVGIKDQIVRTSTNLAEAPGPSTRQFEAPGSALPRPSSSKSLTEEVRMVAGPPGYVTFKTNLTVVDHFYLEQKRHISNSPSCSAQVLCSDGYMYVHKPLLTTYSKMFAKELLEDTSEMPVIMVPDYPVAEVAEALIFLYTGKIVPKDITKLVDINAICQLLHTMSFTPCDFRGFEYITEECEERKELRFYKEHAKAKKNRRKRFYSDDISLSSIGSISTPSCHPDPSAVSPEIPIVPAEPVPSASTSTGLDSGAPAWSGDFVSKMPTYHPVSKNLRKNPPSAPNQTVPAVGPKSLISSTGSSTAHQNSDNVEIISERKTENVPTRRPGPASRTHVTGDESVGGSNESTFDQEKNTSVTKTRKDYSKRKRSDGGKGSDVDESNKLEKPKKRFEKSEHSDQEKKRKKRRRWSDLDPQSDDENDGDYDDGGEEAKDVDDDYESESECESDLALDSSDLNISRRRETRLTIHRNQSSNSDADWRPNTRTKSRRDRSSSCASTSTRSKDSGRTKFYDVDMSDDEDTFKCWSCQDAFGSEKALSTHISTKCGKHLNGKYTFLPRRTCGICHKIYSSDISYSTMMKEVEECFANDDKNAQKKVERSALSHGVNAIEGLRNASDVRSTVMVSGTPQVNRRNVPDELDKRDGNELPPSYFSIVGSRNINPLASDFIKAPLVTVRLRSIPDRVLDKYRKSKRKNRKSPKKKQQLVKVNSVHDITTSTSRSQQVVSNPDGRTADVPIKKRRPGPKSRTQQPQVTSAPAVNTTKLVGNSRAQIPPPMPPIAPLTGPPVTSPPKVTSRRRPGPKSRTQQPVVLPTAVNIHQGVASVINTSNTSEHQVPATSNLTSNGSRNLAPPPATVQKLEVPGPSNSNPTAAFTVNPLIISKHLNDLLSCPRCTTTFKTTTLATKCISKHGFVRCWICLESNKTEDALIHSKTHGIVGDEDYTICPLCQWRVCISTFQEHMVLDHFPIKSKHRPLITNPSGTTLTLEQEMQKIQETSREFVFAGVYDVTTSSSSSSRRLTRKRTLSSREEESIPLSKRPLAGLTRLEIQREKEERGRVIVEQATASLDDVARQRSEAVAAAPKKVRFAPENELRVFTKNSKITNSKSCVSTTPAPVSGNRNSSSTLNTARRGGGRGRGRGGGRGRGRGGPSTLTRKPSTTTSGQPSIDTSSMGSVVPPTSIFQSTPVDTNSLSTVTTNNRPHTGLKIQSDHSKPDTICPLVNTITTSAASGTSSAVCPENERTQPVLRLTSQSEGRVILGQQTTANSMALVPFLPPVSFPTNSVRTATVKVQSGGAAASNKSAPRNTSHMERHMIKGQQTTANSTASVPSRIILPVSFPTNSGTTATVKVQSSGAATSNKSAPRNTTHMEGHVIKGQQTTTNSTASVASRIILPVSFPTKSGTTATVNVQSSGAAASNKSAPRNTSHMEGHVMKGQQTTANSTASVPSRNILPVSFPTKSGTAATVKVQSSGAAASNKSAPRNTSHMEGQQTTANSTASVPSRNILPVSFPTNSQRTATVKVQSGGAAASIESAPRKTSHMEGHLIKGQQTTANSTASLPSRNILPVSFPTKSGTTATAKVQSSGASTSVSYDPPTSRNISQLEGRRISRQETTGNSTALVLSGHLPALSYPINCGRAATVNVQSSEATTSLTSDPPTPRMTSQLEDRVISGKQAIANSKVVVASQSFPILSISTKSGGPEAVNVQSSEAATLATSDPPTPRMTSQLEDRVISGEQATANSTVVVASQSFPILSISTKSGGPEAANVQSSEAATLATSDPPTPRMTSQLVDRVISGEQATANSTALVPSQTFPPLSYPINYGRAATVNVQSSEATTSLTSDPPTPRMTSQLEDRVISGEQATANSTALVPSQTFPPPIISTKSGGPEAVTAQSSEAATSATSDPPAIKKEEKIDGVGHSPNRLQIPVSPLNQKLKGSPITPPRATCASPVGENSTSTVSNIPAISAIVPEVEVITEVAAIIVDLTGDESPQPTTPGATTLLNELEDWSLDKDVVEIIDLDSDDNSAELRRTPDVIASCSSSTSIATSATTTTTTSIATEVTSPDELIKTEPTEVVDIYTEPTVVETSTSEKLLLCKDCRNSFQDRELYDTHLCY